MTSFDIIRRPVISERSLEGMAEGKYTFVVDPRANKTQIKQAVEEIFKVNVIKVNTIRMQGKQKRMGLFVGRRPQWKKAIVQIKEGQTISAFEDLL